MADIVFLGVIIGLFAVALLLIRRVDDGSPGPDAGLAVQNFMSAAVGLAVAVALIPRAHPAALGHHRRRR